MRLKKISFWSKLEFICWMLSHFGSERKTWVLNLNWNFDYFWKLSRMLNILIVRRIFSLYLKVFFLDLNVFVFNEFKRLITRWKIFFEFGFFKKSSLGKRFIYRKLVNLLQYQLKLKLTIYLRFEINIWSNRNWN